jgi:hypothetical protein
MAKRLEFKKSVKIAILRRAGWPEKPVCEGCGLPLRGKRIEVDHTLECWEKPDRTELTAEDGRALGECCHRPKTARKNGERAHGNRIIEKAAGVKPKRRRGFQTNRDGPYKKPFGGNAVKRSKPALSKD